MPAWRTYIDEAGKARTEYFANIPPWAAEPDRYVDTPDDDDADYPGHYGDPAWEATPAGPSGSRHGEYVPFSIDLTDPGFPDYPQGLDIHPRRDRARRHGKTDLLMAMLGAKPTPTRDPIAGIRHHATHPTGIELALASILGLTSGATIAAELAVHGRPSWGTAIAAVCVAGSLRSLIRRQ